jgi:predicted nucleic acid-binding protein
VFVDASGFVAAVNRNDQQHVTARDTLRLLVEERRSLFTSNIIVAETHALLLRRVGRDRAADWVRETPSTVLFPDEDDHAQATELLARYADKDFSYADAVSFVLMERLGIATAFTFDEHFRQYGVATLP